MPMSKPSPTIEKLKAEIAALQNRVERDAYTIVSVTERADQARKDADSNYENGQEWKKLAAERDQTIKKSREEFATLKIQHLEVQLQVASLQGYQHRVREEDDNRRPPVEHITVGTVGGTRLPSGRVAEFRTPMGDRAIDGEGRRHWTNYGN